MSNHIRDSIWLGHKNHVTAIFDEMQTPVLQLGNKMFTVRLMVQHCILLPEYHVHRDRQCWIAWRYGTQFARYRHHVFACSGKRPGTNSEHTTA